MIEKDIYNNILIESSLIKKIEDDSKVIYGDFKVKNTFDENEYLNIETVLENGTCLTTTKDEFYHTFARCYKEEVINYLQNETIWSFNKEAEHFDCLIHYGAWYLKSLIARRNHELPEYSVMVSVSR